MKGIGREILTRVIGFVIFLVLIGILNLLTYYIQNSTLSAIVTFLNNNLLLIIVFTIIFIIAEIFYYLWFPLSLPAPLLSAFASVLLVSFIFNLFKFIMTLVGVVIVIPYENLIYWIIVVIVFIVVVIVGYIRIITHAARKRERSHREHESSERHSVKKRHGKKEED
jgi:hypothetical protein